MPSAGFEPAILAREWLP